ncbi:putative RNA helicase [Medicago truncatula]|uniref:RNA helicase n=1 Tax=Medicago truncatula TaxID=3880 RepID=A0A072TT13_MEDTR|nr:probable pre-mRNA-splicing factor ATP-dependent RNA helicase DEAH4 [Medicago truncatula]KEH20562.1 pre-mRNA splicing factor ATP-dependent RNA helicase [Medicago truncatula]RHN42458.1 putative RNA helicase [Medicago truncatula]
MATLPIVQYEEKIIETVENNSITVIIGETGSGKSTQLSQMLHRRGYSKIAVTQPRRVAAVSVSRRVAQELGVQLGEEVGYAIRFEDRTSRNTRIKYLTDGVLLRESLADPELNDYSVIILDEAHERSLNTDILMGLMKRLVKIRSSNLKVLITSATLDGDKVSKFFRDCPVLNIPGKLYPVEVLYSKERPVNYLDAALKTALDIHIRQPEGDILIFMTGQDDIEKLVMKMEEKVRALDEGSCMDAIIFPLHGSLPPELQVRVFSPPPPNCRRIIVATNIAETSLTVDGVVYVIDSGYVKQRQYNPSSRMYSLDVVQISKVQANQRAGRAGRTRPGKCYRLYPSQIYHDEFLDVTVPEIQRSSLAGSVLYLKSLDLPDIDILKFDFLDSPSPESLRDALKQLYLIDAIDENGSITSVGRKMAELPLEPSLSRTLMEANNHGCITEALTVAAMLSSETALLPGQSKTEKKRKRPISNLPDGSGLGDHIQLLQIFERWHQTDYDIGWCKDHGLQVRGMSFARDVRKQLSQIMQKIAKEPLGIRTNGKGEEIRRDYRNLRKALCVGYANQLAERKMHHNGYRTLGFQGQVVQVHPSSALSSDEFGKFPDYVVYHELIATPRPFMRNVCSVEMKWVIPIINKLNTLNVYKLSGGGMDHFEEESERNIPNLPKKNVEVAAAADDSQSRIQAARERFLARKVNK